MSQVETAPTLLFAPALARAIEPPLEATVQPPGVLARNWRLLVFVILPTLVSAVLLFGVAADQYVSETMFVVRGIQPEMGRGGGLGDLLGVAGGFSPAQAEARSIGFYLGSHDAVRALKDRGIDLVQVYRRPEADMLTRLWFARPTAEFLGDYYRAHTDIAYDPDDGVTKLTVRAFRPGDSRAVAAALLQLGEARINQFNRRAQATAVAAARGDIGAAEGELTDIQRRMTRFREARSDFDPRANAGATQELRAKIEGELVNSRAQLAAMRAAIGPGAPQIVALERRIRAYETQAARQSGRLTGAAGGLAPRLADYEELQLRQGFAAKRYDAARAALELARQQAIKQQLFVIPVVLPNLPEKSLAPRRWTILASIFAGLLVTYGIARLLVAGVREHEA